jgi:hypothetical protein
MIDTPRMASYDQTRTHQTLSSDRKDFATKNTSILEISYINDASWSSRQLVSQAVYYNRKDT